MGILYRKNTNLSGSLAYKLPGGFYFFGFTRVTSGARTVGRFVDGDKNYPFEVKISSKKINGVVLSDQIKSLDWKTRAIEYVGKETLEKVEEIISKFSVLIFG